MTAKSKFVLYLFLLLFAVVGAVLHMVYAVEVAKSLALVATASTPFAIALLDWIVPSTESMRNARREVCQNALARITREVKNFQQLIDAQKAGRVFAGNHKQAVEVVAFDLLQQDVTPLLRFWSYWWTTSAVLKELKRNAGKPISEMKLNRLMELLTVLSTKLTNEINP